MVAPAMVAPALVAPGMVAPGLPFGNFNMANPNDMMQWMMVYQQFLCQQQNF